MPKPSPVPLVVPDGVLLVGSLGSMTGNEIKVLLALVTMETAAKVVPGDPFPATLDAVRHVAHLSIPTVAAARARLVKLHAVAPGPEGSFRILRNVVGPETTARKNLVPLQDSFTSRILQPVEGDAQNYAGTRTFSRELKDSLPPYTPSRGIRGSRSTAISPLSEIGENLKEGYGTANKKVSSEDRRLAVHVACQTLGLRDTGKYAQLAMAKLSLLLKDGASVADALHVATWARAQWDGGDRFPSFLNLLYIWSRSKFDAFLAASQSPVPASFGEYRVMPAGGSRDVWDAAHAQKLQDRGLA